MAAVDQSKYEEHEGEQVLVRFALPRRATGSRSRDEASHVKRDAQYHRNRPNPAANPLASYRVARAGAME
eukprot:CAMPEP_0118821674 /NCGR_PEP_ID=MMETSP1162-20130426/8653_1 /TAXON_ID=33656 /ORGANISM="Phaeocystis Sp, Strain CCMP2710" /LENGTH=69 /DNA_ID=CAMNT_0006752155 /DNA_START=12 /DNA_END=221 /DNA_ORIENTATION=+